MCLFEKSHLPDLYINRLKSISDGVHHAILKILHTYLIFSLRVVINKLLYLPISTYTHFCKF
jgi:hypothetical protein